MPIRIIQLISFIVFSIFWFSGEIFWTSVGLGFTFYILVRLLDQMGQTIPIIELMIALAALQWILGPYIEYGREFEHYKYKMYVDQVTYMSFVVPAVLLFWIGSSLFRTQIDLDDMKYRIEDLLDEHPYFPYILVVGGIIVPFLSDFFPPSLGFVFFLLSNVKYIGAIYLIHSSHRYRYYVFFGVLTLSIASSLAAGMFHDLVLWSMLLFTFLAKEWKFTFFLKIVSALLGVGIAMTIQAVKLEYRVYAWDQGYEGNKAALFLRIASREWSSGNIVMPSQDVQMNARLNQGWIISAIMYHVPDNEPHARGSTIKDAFVASFLPRFLYPNKPIAGGRKNFRKYTGLLLSDSTSMGISIAGEGWANFGYFGGLIFMFLWGLFINWFWRFLERRSEWFPTLLLWSPILFLQVVKAETELTVVLNHLIKASIVVFGLIWGIRFVWGMSGNDGEEEADSAFDQEIVSE